MIDEDVDLLKAIDAIAQREGVAMECAIDDRDPDVVRLHHLERPTSTAPGAGARAVRALLELGRDVTLACIDDEDDVDAGRGLRAFYSSLGFGATSTVGGDGTVETTMRSRRT